MVWVWIVEEDPHACFGNRKNDSQYWVICTRFPSGAFPLTQLHYQCIRPMPPSAERTPIPQYRLPLLTSPRQTSNLSLSCTRRIPFCHTTPRTHPALFLLSMPTPGSCFVSCTCSCSLIVAISVRSTVVLLCLKFGLVGGGGGVCSSYDVGPGPTSFTVPRIRHTRTRIRGCRT